MELQRLVRSFIEKGSEGSNWDFKQIWHTDKVDLLKDIVCMANNTTADMLDGYIIFGVVDKTYEIVGISGDKNRRNQEQVIGFLSDKKWSGEEIPDVEVKTVEIDGKEIDVLIVLNKSVTPYYLLEDYPRKDACKKAQTVIRAGVVYSRVGDRNTSSAGCAQKQAIEFLWKKRFGLAGSDHFKVCKRLQTINSWHSTDEYDTLFNRDYSDIRIERDRSHNLEVKIEEGSHDTATWVMNFPYLFTSMLNWNTGKEETCRQAKWDIFLENRKLDISLFGVQATKQTYYHIEPECYWCKEFGVHWDRMTDSIPYYAYRKDSIKYLAFKLFFEMQCYREDEKALNKAFTVIPVFENEFEQTEFLKYVKKRKENFRKHVESQDIEEMFPDYSRMVDTVICYKLGKTLVQWRGSSQ